MQSHQTDTFCLIYGLVRSDPRRLLSYVCFQREVGYKPLNLNCKWSIKFFCDLSKSISTHISFNDLEKAYDQSYIRCITYNLYKNERLLLNQDLDCQNA